VLLWQPFYHHSYVAASLLGARTKGEVMTRRTPTHSPRRRRPPTVLGALIGAYLIPALSTYLNARLIHNPTLGRAAWTTISIPSAIAAAGATAWALPRLRMVGSTTRAVVRAALGWAAAAAAVTGWLVGNGWADAMAFTELPVAAAMGAAIATRKVRKFRQSSGGDPDRRGQTQTDGITRNTTLGARA
jgi:hypothetical protein